MDEFLGCGLLIGIIIAVVIAIYALIYVILPVSIVILGGIGLVGAVSGVGVAVRNCQQLLVEAHKVER
jgi:hypothetical protein